MIYPIVTEYIFTNYMDDIANELVKIRYACEELYSNRDEESLHTAILGSETHDRNVAHTTVRGRIVEEADYILRMHYITLADTATPEIILAILETIIAMDTIDDKEQAMALLANPDTEEGFSSFVNMVTGIDTSEVLIHILKADPIIIKRMTDLLGNVPREPVDVELYKYKRTVTRMKTLAAPHVPIGYEILIDWDGSTELSMDAYLNLVGNRVGRTDPVKIMWNLLSIAALTTQEPQRIVFITRETINKRYDGDPLSISITDELNRVDMHSILID